MKQILTFVLVLFSLQFYAQEKETITQNRADHIGVKTKKDFKVEPHVTWYDESYNQYEFDEKIIKKLRKLSDGVTIKVFMSVWCHDSHREIPRLYKILEAINFDEKNLEVIALNRAKKTPDNLQEGFDIKRTPTLIFFKKGEEIARYVEKPRKSLEKDLLAILKGKDYKHSYQIH